MTHSKFSLDGPAFEDSSPQVIQPDHIMLLKEEVGVHTQIFQPPPESPAPREEQREQAADVPENPVLKCMMEDACDHLHAFQEYEHYSLVVNSELDCDVPEDELTDEMEDSYELLHESVNGDDFDLKDVNETALKRAIHTGAPETGEPRHGSPEAFDQVKIN